MAPVLGLPALLAVPAFIVKLTPWLVAGFFYGAVFANGYGAFKVLWQRVLKRAFPVNRATKFIDATVKLLPNALGFVNAALPWFGLPALFIPPAPDLRAYMASTAGAVEVLPPLPTPPALPSDDPRPSMLLGFPAGDATPTTPFPPAPDAPTGPSTP